MASLASPSTLPSSAQVATARGMCARQRDLVATPVAKAVTTEATKFLTEEGIVRSSLGQRLAKQSLDRPVGFGDRRAVRLQRRADSALEVNEGKLRRRVRGVERQLEIIAHVVVPAHRVGPTVTAAAESGTWSTCMRLLRSASHSKASKGISPSRWLGAAVRSGCSAAPVTLGAPSGGRRAPAPSGTQRQRMTARICRMRIWR